jgi:hypothetical protein
LLDLLHGLFETAAVEAARLDEPGQGVERAGRALFVAFGPGLDFGDGLLQPAALTLARVSGRFERAGGAGLDARGALLDLLERFVETVALGLPGLRRASRSPNRSKSSSRSERRGGSGPRRGVSATGRARRSIRSSKASSRSRSLSSSGSTPRSSAYSAIASSTQASTFTPSDFASFSAIL